MTYALLKRVIDAGRYIDADMQNKLDVFYTFGRITQEQYEELTSIVSKEQA